MSAAYGDDDRDQALNIYLHEAQASGLKRVRDHSLALFDVALATLPLGGSDAQRLGRANRLKSWRETCLSCTLSARFTRDPLGGRVSFVGRVRLTNTRARKRNLD